MTSLRGYNPNNLQPWLRGVIISMTALSLLSVALRILSRRIKGQRFWWDDWMIMFSMAWNLLVIGFIFGMYAEGMGIHADKVSPHDIIMMAKFLLVAEILYVYNLVWTKLSVLLMYYRIFHFAYFKRLAYIIGGFVVIWVICITFLFIFICVPVQKLWYPELPGHCINQVATWIANAASTILTDVAILTLPIPRVWKLQLRMGEKIALTFAFGLGFFVVFASTYRFTVLFSYTDLDPTYTLAPTVGWTCIEMSAGIISACLPTLLPALNLCYSTLRKIVGLPSVAEGSTMGRSKTGGVTNRSQQHSLPGLGGKDKDTCGSDKIGHSRNMASGGGGYFYRLSDDELVSGGDMPKAVASDGKLRPEHGYKYAVTSLPCKGEGDSLSGDEIPLQGIRVQKEFVHSGGEGDQSTGQT